jgi:hypothetical protein
MNCGDWVESCTALVEDINGHFHLLDWSVPRTESAVLVQIERERLRA